MLDYTMQNGGKRLPAIIFADGDSQTLEALPEILQGFGYTPLHIGVRLRPQTCFQLLEEATGAAGAAVRTVSASDTYLQERCLTTANLGDCDTAVLITNDTGDDWLGTAASLKDAGFCLHLFAPLNEAMLHLCLMADFHRTTERQGK